jgi:radical SAM enzyme (TIGR01210 family)
MHMQENEKPEQRSLRRHRDQDRAASVWRERESVEGKPTDAGVVILQTSGCRHFHTGGCSMCGYNIDSNNSISQQNITKQFDGAMDQLDGISFLKIYTSGSFLDECEITSDTSDHILKRCADANLRLLFESRPEYVTTERLDHMLAIHDDLEIALGLESSNDNVLRYSINKGFAVEDYEKATTILNVKGIDVRTYVLLKPPFLTESEAIEDAKATIAFAARTSKTISLNPVNVQRGTLVEKLWRNWAYRPPWLWSVVMVLRESDSNGKRLICDPTGGGKERGAHNCGKCDDVILDSIRAFSLSQDYTRLGVPECECKEPWQSIIDVEQFVMGGSVDLQRFFAKSRKRR